MGIQNTFHKRLGFVERMDQKSQKNFKASDIASWESSFSPFTIRATPACSVASSTLWKGPVALLLTFPAFHACCGHSNACSFSSRATVIASIASHVLLSHIHRLANGRSTKERKSMHQQIKKLNAFQSILGGFNCWRLPNGSTAQMKPDYAAPAGGGVGEPLEHRKIASPGERTSSRRFATSKNRLEASSSASF